MTFLKPEVRPGLVAHTLNPSTWEQKQENFCEFEASPVYTVSSKIARAM